MNVAMFGLGYVGTVTAACLASKGHRIVGVDPELGKVIAITGGSSPVVEPELDELVRVNVGAGRLLATADPAVGMQDADLAVVCVGTPSRSDGGVDVEGVRRAASEIGTFLQTSDRYVVVMFRSTVPPGTVEHVLVPALEAASGHRVGERFGVVMCPEFLREGTGVADFFDPPFTVVGADEERASKVALDLFSFLDRPVHVVPLAIAEGLKYACNAFHAVKISFANEIGRICRAVDVDARTIMELLCEDRRLNIASTYLRPGFAYGGSCLPKDLDALLHVARANCVDAPLLSGARATNELVSRTAVREILDTGMRRVTLLGLSFKPQTDDLRASPFVELAEALVGKGIDLTVFDPIIRPDRLFGANLRYVQQRLPHLQRLLVDDVARSLVCSDVAVVGIRTPAIVSALSTHAPKYVFDLVGGLGEEIESLPGYRGVSW